MKRSLGQRGFSLVEAMVGIVILLVISLGVATSASNLYAMQRNASARSSAEALRIQLATYSATTKGFKTSLQRPENSLFLRCVQTPNGSCYGSGKDITLRALNDPGDSSGILSGPASAPALFDVNLGTGCTTSCAFSVVTSFASDCGADPSCANLTGFTINYDIFVPDAANVKIQNFRGRHGSFRISRACLLSVVNNLTPNCDGI